MQAAKKPPLVPSDEQGAVIETDASLVVVNAFAGTGKTTTSILFSEARPKERFLYLCLNRANQVEARARFGRNVIPMTTHGAAMSKMRSRVGNRLDEKWKPLSFGEEMKIGNYRHAAATQSILRTFFSSADTSLNEDHAQVAKLQWDLSDRDASNCFGFAVQAWNHMHDPSHHLGIPHDAYLKMFALTSPKLDFDWIICDEWQDANPVTSQIVLGQSDCKLLCIGDRHQSIYAFRGAINAMETYSAMPNAKSLSLTKTWRFGEEIADVATTLLREFKGERESIKGMGTAGAWNPDKVTLLSRTNANLFMEAAAVEGKDVHWMGGIDNYRISVVLDAYNLYANNRSEIQDPFIKKFQSWGSFVEYGENVRDPETKMLQKIVEEYRGRTVSLAQNIRANAVGEPEKARTILTTAHKSKGLDWDCVRICDDFKVFSDIEDYRQQHPYAPLSLALEQEVNLLYVAVTRARKSLQLNDETKDWLADLPERQNVAPRAPAPFESLVLGQSQPQTVQENVLTSTDEYHKSLPESDRAVFDQSRGGFVICSQPELGAFPRSYKHAVQALARSRGVVLTDAEACISVEGEVVDGQAFNKSVQQAQDVVHNMGLGFTLPHDWTGQVEIVGVIERDGKMMRAEDVGENPEAFQLYARKGRVQPGEDAFAFLVARPTEWSAQDLADRLVLIDAHSQVNEHDKTAKLARIAEERVRRDQNSTDEDISVAKEVRKNAEFTAMQSDEGLQRRTAEFDRANTAPAHPERVRRIADLSKLEQRAGAAYTFGQLAVEAIKLAGSPDAVNWTDVEDQAMVLCIGKFGQTQHSVTNALCLHSPGAVGADRQDELLARIRKCAPMLKAQFNDQSRTGKEQNSTRGEYAFQRIGN